MIFVFFLIFILFAKENYKNENENSFYILNNNINYINNIKKII